MLPNLYLCPAGSQTNYISPMAVKKQPTGFLLTLFEKDFKGRASDGRLGGMYVSYYIVRPHTDTATLPLVFPLSLLFFRLWVRFVFKNQTTAWGKVVVLS